MPNENEMTVETTAADPELMEAFGLEAESAAPSAEENGAPAGDQSKGQQDKETQNAQTPGKNAQAQEGKPGGQEMTTQQRHAQAEARRQREKAAMAMAEQQRLDSVYAELFAGQVNPYTGKPIQSRKDYEEYQRQMREAQTGDALKNAGIDKSLLEQLIGDAVANHPDVVAARETKEQLMQQQRVKEQAKAEKAVADGIARIHAVDESINSLEDLEKAPYKDAFLGYLQKGLSMEDAYYLANRAGMEKKQSAAAKQAAINQYKGKSGMATDAGAGSGGELVPAEEAARFREFMPDATPEQIQKAWTDYKKGLK